MFYEHPRSYLGASVRQKTTLHCRQQQYVSTILPLEPEGQEKRRRKNPNKRGSASTSKNASSRIFKTRGTKSRVPSVVVRNRISSACRKGLPIDCGCGGYPIRSIFLVTRAIITRARCARSCRAANVGCISSALVRTVRALILIYCTKTHYPRIMQYCSVPVYDSILKVRNVSKLSGYASSVRGWGGGVCCQTFSFVLFSLFSRPRAGLATV